ncbi:MAG TPA: D-sedoheptulose 7-phosphate isomerase [Puia sp.]|nr:D-sedoheptulose 7-phosphate isomerase [Puia sp.]
MNKKIQDIISESIALKNTVLQDSSLLKTVENIVQIIVAALKKGKHIYFCGNGGSAADAQHLAAEFSGRFYLDRDALPAEALHCNTSYLTAVANDYSYDVVYSRLLRGLAHEGDILVGLSTSGNSINIVKAFETAREKNVSTIGFTGEGGGKMKDLSDYLVAIPSKTTPRIQEVHMLLGHIICQLVEELYFASVSPKEGIKTL